MWQSGIIRKVSNRFLNRCPSAWLSAPLWSDVGQREAIDQILSCSNCGFDLTSLKSALVWHIQDSIRYHHTRDDYRLYAQATWTTCAPWAMVYPTRLDRSQRGIGRWIR